MTANLISTTARVIKDLYPKNAGGKDLESKKIDYAISLVLDTDMDRLVRSRLSTQPRESQVINQTDYSPVRYQPIAINIETKANATDDEAMMQLATWISAYHKGVSRFLPPQSKITTLPLLYTAVDRWSLYFACDHIDHIVGSFHPGLSSCHVLTIVQDILGKLALGDTSSLLGCYKLLAIFRRLCTWAVTIFKSWVKDELLGSLPEEGPGGAKDGNDKA